MLIGANLALSVSVFGWLPIAYGLGFWPSLSATLLGTLAGAAFTTPLALLGHRAATNNSVASGATFGVLGRLIGSVIGLLLCLGYTALTVWTGGEALAGGVARLTDSSFGDGADAIAYAVIAVGVTVAAIYGYRILLRLNSILVAVVGLAIVLGVIAYAADFDASYAGDADAYLLGSFRSTWLLAFISAGMSGPISYATLLGDWTRHVRPDIPSRQVLRGTAVGLVAGLLVPTLFGVYAATATLGDPERSFVAGLVEDAPGWYVPILIIAALGGSLGQAGVNLYSMGLDLDAVLPRLTRVQSTMIVAAVSTALVYLGAFVWEAETAVTTFVLVVTSMAVPWATIAMLGLHRAGGEVDRSALQVFNKGMRGGRYWYRRGWNVNATVAWLLASVCGVLANATDTYTGPIADLAGGIDVSVLVSAVIAALAYVLLERLRPANEIPQAATMGATT